MAQLGQVRCATDDYDAFIQALKARWFWDVSVVLENVMPFSRCCTNFLKGLLPQG